MLILPSQIKRKRLWQPRSISFRAAASAARQLCVACSPDQMHRAHACESQNQTVLRGVRSSLFAESQIRACLGAVRLAREVFRLGNGACVCKARTGALWTHGCAEVTHESQKSHLFSLKWQGACVTARISTPTAALCNAYIQTMAITRQRVKTAQKSSS